MTTSRTLAAALAIGVLAVPAAQAQPADNAPRRPAPHARVQDLRHLRAGAANVRPRGARDQASGGQYTPGATAVQTASRRQLLARRPGL